MPRISASLTPAERDSSRTLVTIAVIVAALYFGREIFVPIALAILLSFVLAPGIRKLNALGLGRVLPVLIATLLAFAVIFSMAGVMAVQLREIAADLPRYESTIATKAEALRSLTSGGQFQRLEAMFGKLGRTIAKDDPPAAQTRQGASPEGGKAAKQAPMLVQIDPAPMSSIDALSGYILPLLHPIAMGGIVVIFVVFILLQREDLRNRLIRLFGATDLQRTTVAIDDGAKRLSRYLLTQSLLNASTGLLVGVAAWAIGVPNPVLWGILFTCMRFVPYIGPVIGGAFPVAFAAVVDPGWSLALWMAGIVLALEFVAGQVLEPLLYGHNTGLSPVAVVMSATFWTVLWGPIGLLLATPLTVCLVVIGRHVEQLEFLEVLLGDRPPLSASETFYQRMLANDPVEVADQARTCLKTMSFSEYCDRVMLPGLLLAQSDVTAERLSVDRQTEIRDATIEVLDDLAEEENATSKTKPQGWRNLLPSRGDQPEEDTEASGADKVPDDWQRPGSVICLGARGPLDDCGALMLAHILRARGIGTQSESYARLSKSAIGQLDLSSARLICLSSFDGSSAAYLHFALRRVRRHAPAAKILIGSWWKQNDEAVSSGFQDEERDESEPASACTILDAVRYCLAAASSLDENELTRETPREQPELASAE